jgi:D-arginine dehydrogenase
MTHSVMTDFDVIIVGAGMAGASLAAELAPFRRVLMLEAEAAPGYHATGRSAAFWSECYGGPGVQSLTKASKALLANPPTDFSDVSFLRPRGALHIAQSGREDLSVRMMADFADKKVNISQIGVEQIARLVPGIRPDWSAGIWEPDCCDIDVAGLHSAYLRAAKRHSARLVCNARVVQAVQVRNGWRVETSSGDFTGKLLINAAGAWPDNLAAIANVTPAGIKPFRRTIVQIGTEPAADPLMPLVIGLDASFYFKANADGSIWLSPHDETPSAACDTAPEEFDIAKAIDRLHQVVDWKIRKVQHKWAGLRSFAADRLPVIGHDPNCLDFFWFAGQGGFGIQTAPAAAKLAASIILETGHGLEGVVAGDFGPERLF